MKAILIALTICLAVSALACRPSSSSLSPDDEFTHAYDNDIGLLVDQKTGCHYIIRAGTGISPRLNAAGKPMCANTGGGVSQ